MEWNWNVWGVFAYYVLYTEMFIVRLRENCIFAEKLLFVFVFIREWVKHCFQPKYSFTPTDMPKVLEFGIRMRIRMYVHGIHVGFKNTFFSVEVN